MKPQVKPLIDMDIATYQCSFGGEIKEEDGTVTILSFDYVASLVDKLIADICLAVGATEAPILYLTGGGNFRDKVAVTKLYKGNRTKPKPFHYKNARAYIMSLPNAVMVEGMEADDAMSIEQTNAVKFYKAEYQTVICTRDKDLRMVPGLHYGWEHGLQPEFFLQEVDELGAISYDSKKNKISGTGMLFFYSQLITGDTVDNIPGLPKKGPKAAWVALEGKQTSEEAFSAVVESYKLTMGDDWKTYLLEMGRLLWMCREVDVEGKPVMWEIPDGC